MVINNPDWERIVGQHRAAHPYFLDGVKHERERIIGIIEDSIIDRHEADDDCDLCKKIEEIIEAVKGDNK